jgi:hypothetical protein
MEATSTYWKPPSCLLEDAVKCWLVDTAWLCKLAERGMLRPSFVPPPWQRELRDLCRYRRILIQERTREKQRAEKLLEDTQIKLSSVISGIFGKSGQRNPSVLAELARGSMRGKKSVLQEALTGQFRDHEPGSESIKKFVVVPVKQPDEVTWTAEAWRRASFWHTTPAAQQTAASRQRDADNRDTTAVRRRDVGHETMDIL